MRKCQNFVILENFMSGKLTLVTGGAGFIGSHFIEYMINHDEAINKRFIVLDNLTYAGDVENLRHAISNSNVKFIHGDVRNSQLVEDLVSKCENIIHFAAETHVSRSLADSKIFVETDVMGTHSVLAAISKYSKRIRSFVHVSTSEVYGTDLAGTMNEDHPLNPMSPYAAAKCSADRLVYSFFASFNIPGFIIRPFNNYGPRQHPEKFAARSIASHIIGQPITIHGDGRASRDWNYVTDTCAFIYELMNLDSRKFEPKDRVFNFGSGISTATIELAKMIFSIRPDRLELIEFLEDRPGQVNRHCADMSKAIRYGLPRPKIDLHQGLDLTYNWFESNENWWKQRLTSSKIRIKLPDGKSILH